MFISRRFGSVANLAQLYASGKFPERHYGALPNQGTTAMPDVTLHLVAMILGATIGLLLVVNVFRLAAGVRFAHWRHVLAAYVAGVLWAACASEHAIGFVLAAPIAIGLELMLLGRRSVATQASSL